MLSLIICCILIGKTKIKVAIWQRFTMVSQKKLLKISDELLIQRCGYGVKLIKPDHKKHTQNGYYTVAQALSLPVSIYFLNTESVIQNINESNLICLRETSAKNCIGKTAFNFLIKNEAQHIINNDIEIMRSNSVKIIEENVNQSPYISIKIPWYDEKEKIIGLMGLSINLDRQSLSESLFHAKKLGLMDFSASSSNVRSLVSGLHINNTYFSKREIEIMREVVSGKTSKKIAEKFNVSSSIIDQHLDNIKFKLGGSFDDNIVERIKATLNEN